MTKVIVVLQRTILLTLLFGFRQRCNFVCDGGDMSPPLLNVLMSVTTTENFWASGKWEFVRGLLPGLRWENLQCCSRPPAGAERACCPLPKNSTPLLALWASSYSLRTLHVPSEVTTIFSCKVATLAFIMATLRSRCRHYIFVLWFLHLPSFFPCLFSAVADWMSTILLHMVQP